MNAQNRDQNHGQAPATLDAAGLDAIVRPVLEAHGTLRDLLDALADHADFVVPGGVFREGLDRYQLTGTFLHVLQDPRVLDALVGIEARVMPGSNGSGGQTLLTFNFGEPQTLPRQMALGTVKFYFAAAVGVLVQAGGDAVLREDDISVGWLVFREAVALRIVREELPAGSQDVLRVSAGTALSRQVVLKPLRLPEGFEPAA